MLGAKGSARLLQEGVVSALPDLESRNICHSGGKLLVRIISIILWYIQEHNVGVRAQHAAVIIDCHD